MLFPSRSRGNAAGPAAVVGWKLPLPSPLDGDLRLGRRGAEQGSDRGWATMFITQTLWRAGGQLVLGLCESDFVKSMGYMSVPGDKWRGGGTFSLLLESRHSKVVPLRHHEITSRPSVVPASPH